jgi:hypothetical protein
MPEFSYEVMNRWALPAGFINLIKIIMKTSYIFSIVILLTISSCMMQRPYYDSPRYDNRGGGTVSMQYFYDALSPYGNWVHNREYGYVWIPDAGRDFYPYATNGRWVMTEYGWTWVSGYEWGWAPFHYGRWDYDDYYGWFWFPDYDWAPAWVTWRRGDGYYGWAPMGPGDNQGMGRMRGYEDPYRWVFVRDRDFARSNIARYNVNPRRNEEILRSSRVIENGSYSDMGNRSYNPGPDPADVQRSTGRKINRIAVRESDSPGTRLSNNQLQIYRPRIQRSADVTSRPAPSRITDIKDIRPMRERGRNYQPGSSQGEMREYQPDRSQGRREQAEPEQRAREVQRQNELKQDSMARRNQQLDESRQQQSQREIREARPAERRRAEREQQINQQRRIMKKERETNRQVEADSTPVRKVEREAVSRPRRR